MIPVFKMLAINYAKTHTHALTDRAPNYNANSIERLTCIYMRTK